MDRNIRIGILGDEESAQEFVKAWRGAEAGEPAEEPVERLYFQDLATLLPGWCRGRTKSGSRNNCVIAPEVGVFRA